MEMSTSVDENLVLSYDKYPFERALDDIMFPIAQRYNAGELMMLSTGQDWLTEIAVPIIGLVTVFVFGFWFLSKN